MLKWVFFFFKWVEVGILLKWVEVGIFLLKFVKWVDVGCNWLMLVNSDSPTERTRPEHMCIFFVVRIWLIYEKNTSVICFMNNKNYNFFGVTTVTKQYFVPEST